MVCLCNKLKHIIVQFDTKAISEPHHQIVYGPVTPSHQTNRKGQVALKHLFMMGTAVN
jgi:hypothetical protein